MDSISTSNDGSPAVSTGETSVDLRLLTGEDVDALASNEVGLEAARTAASIVAAGDITVGRVQVGGPDAWTRILVGLVPELDLLGYKQFHKIGKRVFYHLHLFRLSSGDPLAIIDARRITGLRTSMTASVAFGHVFGEDPVNLALIGSGEEAREGLRAIAGAVRLDGARVFSPTAANREALAAKMTADLGVPVRPAASVDEALAGADAAYVATTSAEPLLDAEQVRGLRLVAAVGASQPEFRELTPEVILEAQSVVIDCADTAEEAGELVDAVAAGWDPSAAILLGNFLKVGPPPAGGAPVVFDSVGSVEQDLVLGDLLLRAAEEEGRGHVIAPIASLRTMR